MTPEDEEYLANIPVHFAYMPPQEVGKIIRIPDNWEMRSMVDLHFVQALIARLVEAEKIAARYHYLSPNNPSLDADIDKALRRKKLRAIVHKKLNEDAA